MTEDIVVSVGEYKVFDSGSVISHDNKEIFFEIKKTIKVKIRFITNQEVEGHAANLSYEENHTVLVISLTNFDNTLGTGLTIPADIGVINGSKLYLQFIVYFLSGGTRLLSYTWLTKKEG